MKRDTILLCNYIFDQGDSNPFYSYFPFATFLPSKAC